MEQLNIGLSFSSNAVTSLRKRKLNDFLLVCLLFFSFLHLVCLHAVSLLSVLPHLII